MSALNIHESMLTLRPPLAAYRSTSRQPQFPSTSYISLLLSGLGAGYFTINREYTITDANAHALKWLGMKKDSVVGRQFSSIIPRSPMKMLKAVVEEGVFVDRLLPSYQRPDRLIDLHIYPTNDGAILFFRDLTEEEQQYRDAVRTKVLLQSSLDAFSAQVVVLDREGTVIASNAAWQQFATAQRLGPPSGRRLNYLELFRKPLIGRHDARRIGETLNALLAGGCRTARIVHTWPLKGRVHWFQLNAARFECWGETYLIVANEDVTAVKEAQQASGEMAERLLTLQEEERQRIAEELHDSTAQHLVAIGLNVMKLKSRMPDKGLCSDLFAEIESSVQETSKELRTFSYLLHPPKLEEDGLRATVEQYAHGFGCRTGLRMKVRIADICDAAPYELQRCIFRILQEGLTNIHRHASATAVRLELRYLRQHLHLVVCDDGIGIGGADRGNQKTVNAASMGVGIPGMRARLRQFGGELAIRSGSGGTRLHAIIPLVAGVSESTRWPSARFNGVHSSDVRSA